MGFIGIISDTHISGSDQRIHPGVAGIFKGADLILHAGDITHSSVIDELSGTAPVIAVQGNMDVHGPITRLPLKRIVPYKSLRIGLIHGGGSPQNLRSRIAREFSDDPVDVIAYGHTHVAYIGQKERCLWINPGSATLPRSPVYPTVAIMNIVDGRPQGEIIPLR